MEEKEEKQTNIGKTKSLKGSLVLICDGDSPSGWLQKGTPQVDPEEGYLTCL